MIPPSIKHLEAAANELLSQGYIATLDAFTHPLIGRTFKDEDGRTLHIIGATSETCDIFDGWNDAETNRREVNRFLLEEDIANGTLKELNNNAAITI